MSTFKEITMYAALVLGIVAIIICSVVLPEEGRVSEYRLEYTTNGPNGQYPMVVVVVENGIDSYFTMPGLTMDQGVELVNKLNQDLHKK